MARRNGWLKILLAVAAGAALMLAAHGLMRNWNRPAGAATIDEMARSTMTRLISSLPWTGSDKIQGVVGLGDGRTFIVYTASNLQFHQMGIGVVSSLAWTGSKIRGIAGLGDGRTFIVYTDENMQFFQFGGGPVAMPTPAPAPATGR